MGESDSKCVGKSDSDSDFAIGTDPKSIVKSDPEPESHFNSVSMSNASDSELRLRVRL